MSDGMVTGEKKETSRNKIIRFRFNNMLRMAKEINNYPCVHKDGLVQLLVGEKQYLRICGEQFTPVSLATDTPLSGYGNNQCSTIDKALNCFKTKSANYVKPEDLKKKKERRLQAALILTALQNGRRLETAFRGPLKEFNDIRFVLDEVSLGDNTNRHPTMTNAQKRPLGASRCELLCIAKKGGQWYPLVIELKYKRMGIELVKQVNRYEEELSDYRIELNQLLSAITGETIASGEILKMAIMPYAETNQRNIASIKKTRRLFDESDVVLVEFKEDDGEFGLYPVNV